MKGLFPNILKTPFEEALRESEDYSKHVDYSNDYDDFYIFDFNYLMKNRPKVSVKHLGKPLFHQ